MDSRSSVNAKRLRAKLLVKGFTYSSFATAHGFNERTVKAAVRGERLGPKSRAVLHALKQL